MKQSSVFGFFRVKISFFFLNVLGLLVFPAAGLFAGPPLEGTGLADSGEARNRIIAAAGKYEGVPYRYGGVDRGGLDCSGLVYLSFRDALSVSVPRTTTGLYAWAEKMSAEDDVSPGDLLFFKTTNTGTISHVGIYVGAGRFIHSASEGPVTGVIYSETSDRYWHRTYAGAGRVLPAALPAALPGDGGDFVRETDLASAGAGEGRGGPPSVRPVPVTERAGERGRLLIGIAAAPSWNGFLEDGHIIRGGAAQIRLGAEARSFKYPMLFGLELRPEWDGALGVFRMPITVSWGFDDKFRIFAGPAFSIGDAVLKTPGGDRRYTGGTSWIGAVGITGAPFSMQVPGGDLAFYGEFAWQSYFSEDGADRNWNADFAAGLRFSTGLRYTWHL